MQAIVIWPDGTTKTVVGLKWLQDCLARSDTKVVRVSIDPAEYGSKSMLTAVLDRDVKHAGIWQFKAYASYEVLREWVNKRRKSSRNDISKVFTDNVVKLTREEELAALLASVDET
jgi:hypothetical protein